MYRTLHTVHTTCTAYTTQTLHTVYIHYTYIPVEGRVRCLNKEITQKWPEHMGHVSAHGVNAVQHHVLHLLYSVLCSIVVYGEECIVRYSGAR